MKPNSAGEPSKFSYLYGNISDFFRLLAEIMRSLQDIPSSQRHCHSFQCKYVRVFTPSSISGKSFLSKQTPFVRRKYVQQSIKDQQGELRYLSIYLWDTPYTLLQRDIVGAIWSNYLFTIVTCGGQSTNKSGSCSSQTTLIQYADTERIEDLVALVGTEPRTLKKGARGTRHDIRLCYHAHKTKEFECDIGEAYEY